MVSFTLLLLYGKWKVWVGLCQVLKLAGRSGCVLILIALSSRVLLNVQRLYAHFSCSKSVQIANKLLRITRLLQVSALLALVSTKTGSRSLFKLFFDRGAQVGLAHPKHGQRHGLLLDINVPLRVGSFLIDVEVLILHDSGTGTTFLVYLSPCCRHLLVDQLHLISLAFLRLLYCWIFNWIAS